MIQRFYLLPDLFYQNASPNIEKGDHINLQDIKVSYDWSNLHFKQLQVRNIQFYLYASSLNLILWRANTSKLDPDYPPGSLPIPRSWSAGINVNF